MVITNPDGEVTVSACGSVVGGLADEKCALGHIPGRMPLLKHPGTRSSYLLTMWIFLRSNNLTGKKSMHGPTKNGYDFDNPRY